MKKKETDSIRVRRALREDLDKVYEIEKQSFDDPYSLNFLEFLYDTNHRNFLVAERDKNIIAFVIASADKDIGHIIAIAVHPLERRKTIGRTIMWEVLKILKDTGISTVRLEVRKSNIEAQGFYDFLGFKRSYTIEKYYGDEDAIIYFKNL